MKARLWYFYVAFGAALTAIYYVLPAKIADLAISPIIGWSSVAAIVVGATVHRADLRPVWLLLAAGVAMQVIGDGMYNVQSYLLSGNGISSFIDPVYLAMYPMLVGAVALLVRSRTSGRDRSSFIDAGIITASLGLIAWVLLIAPYIRSGEGGGLDKWISVAYPIGDVVLLATMARLAAGSGRRPTAFWLLVAGVVPMVAADWLYSHLSLSGVYPNHSYIEAGYMLFYVGWGAAALHPSMRDLSSPTQTTHRLTMIRLAFIGSAALVPPVVLFAQAARGRVTDAIAIAIAGAALLGLVLTRTARMMRDVTQERTEARFRTLIDKTSDAIVVVDRKGRIQYHTSSTERMLGRPSSDLLGARLDRLLAESDAMRLLAMLTSETPASTRIEWRAQRTNGDWLDLEVTADDLRGASDLDGIIFTMRDVTERKRLDLEFRRQTLHDPLTRLPNRTHFAVRVDQALKGAKRRDGSIAVLFINLDDFKMVNDSLGHAAGDALLVAVASRLSTVARNEDTVARLGGDEFGLLLENINPEGGADIAAQRIQDALRTPFRVNDRDIPVHCSIGIALGSPWKHTSDDVLRDANLAMSFAKQQGKDRIESFSPAMHQDATRRLEIAADLLGGIEHGELVVFYQPIVDLRSRQVLGAEALVRWQHPRMGLLGPMEFIPVAELTGLIIPIDRWVLTEVCRQAKEWKDHHIAEDPFYVSVNLSARHLQDPSLVSSVKDALDASGLSADGLVLEVTKSELIKDLGSAGASLAILSRLGVRVAVDNFGTGYSSLAHLARFPIHFVKIDRTFVETVNTRDGEMMVRAVVELAHTLGLTAIAEGVEHHEQAMAIADVGCPLAQGNLFSEPLPPLDVAPLIAGHFIGGLATR